MDVFGERGIFLGRILQVEEEGEKGWRDEVGGEPVGLAQS